MNRLLNMAWIGVILSTVTTAQGDEGLTADLRKMQGKWLQQENKRVNAKPELINLIHGRDIKDEEIVALFYLAVKGDRFTFWYDKKHTRQATVKLHPSKDPKAIDLTIGKGKPFLGIYKIDGDTLTICIGDTRTRPTALAAKEGQMLIRYKRDRP